MRAVPTEDLRGAPPRIASLRLQAGANALGSIGFYAVVFLLTPLAIRNLGSDGWGIWQLVGAATTYAALLSLGLGTAIHYQVAVNIARGDVDRLASAFTNARLYLGGAAIALLLLLFATGKPLMRSLVAPDQVEVAWSALMLTVGLTAATLPLRAHTSALGGLQRLDLYGWIQLACSVLLVITVWVGFDLGMKLPGFAALMTAGTLLPMLPSWIVARRILPAGSLRFTTFDGPLFRELLSYSVSTMVYVVGTVVLYQTMKFIAAWRCGGVAAAGEMGLALSIVQTLGVVFLPILGTLHARFGQLHGSGQPEAIRSLLERALVATGLLLVPSLVFLGWEAHLIFDAWVGGQLGGETLDKLALTTRLKLVGQGAYVLALPCYYALLGVGEHRAFGIGMIVAAVGNAWVGWLAAGFVPSIVTLGFVFGGAMLLLAAVVTVPLALRRFPVPLIPLAGRGVLAPLVVCLPAVAVLAWRPDLGSPILELMVDAVVFALCAAPGLEFLRRRYLLPAGGGPVLGQS